MISQTAAMYWLSEHPAMVGFRWSHSHSWGSTWSFLFAAVVSYSSAAVFLHLILLLLRRRRPVPLGPLPAIYSFVMAVVSAVIFLGTLFSAANEIQETRWIWRRSKNPLQWLLCFPIGTRSSGRVFFWTYVFYISRYLHLLRTFCTILRRRQLPVFQLLNRVLFVCMAFLWLEFSQSFQVPAIMATTLAQSAVYGYRFWAAVGLPAATFPLVFNCQVVALGFHLVCHGGVLLLHFVNGGCNGMGAWGFNSVLNSVVLLPFLGFFLRRKRDGEVEGAVCGSSATEMGDELVRTKEKKHS